MSTIVIVGAGLFGSIAANLASKAGHKVIVLDCNKENSGSKPAACLIKPSWISGLGDVAKHGLEVLDEYYDLKTITFTGPKGNSDLLWVDPKTILWPEAINEKVTFVSNGQVFTENNSLYEGIVLVTAGIWTSLLLNVPAMKHLAGVAYIYNGVVDPFLVLYAPYKQIVCFNREPNKIWFGDGSAILASNWTSDDDKRTLERAVNSGLNNPVDREYGLRPYITATGYFKKLADRLYVSTSGGKNGTVIGAYQAKLFIDSI